MVRSNSAFMYLYVPSKSFKWFKWGFRMIFWDVKGRHRWDGHDGPWWAGADVPCSLAAPGPRPAATEVFRHTQFWNPGRLLGPSSSCTHFPHRIASDVLISATSWTFRERWNDWNVDRLIPIILILAILICSGRVPLRIFHNHSVIIPIAQVSVRFCECWCFSVL